MTQSRQISTISEFLLHAQTQFMVFDLGRGLRRIDNQQFFDWENQLAPCAYPRQDHAWFCISFWHSAASNTAQVQGAKSLNITEKYIWYIKLPLDENGLMIQASCNQFLEIVVTALGADLQHTENKDAQLPENPFIFQPSQQQLADCNAHIRKALQDTSRDNSKATHYMQAPSVQDWQSLSVQDIADYVSASNSHSDCATQSALALALIQLPHPVLNCVLASLEGIIVNSTLCQAIINFHRNNHDAVLGSLCLRAISQTKDTTSIVSNECEQHSIGQDYVKQLVLTQQHIDIETAVVIAGRFWQIFDDEECLLLYMHKVAKLDDSFALFTAIYADLVKVPQCRNYMLALLRNSKRSERAAQGIGKLFAK